MDHARPHPTRWNRQIEFFSESADNLCRFLSPPLLKRRTLFAERTHISRDGFAVTEQKETHVYAPETSFLRLYGLPQPCLSGCGDCRSRGSGLAGQPAYTLGGCLRHRLRRPLAPGITSCHS